MGTLVAAQPGELAVLLRRFAKHFPLTQSELSILRELGWEMRAVRRRQMLLTEGTKSRLLFFVVDGFFIRYRILRDGRRQVVNLVIPGDFGGVPGCFFADSLYSLKALTDATVAGIPLERVVNLFETQPRLAAKIFWSFSCGAAMHAEHLVVVGRRSAFERIAHFLLELLTRLQMAGMADKHSFDLPLSQEVLADALGLTQAYVNRVLRKLADENLVVIKGQRVVIKDVEELAVLADFARDYLKPLPISEFTEGRW